MVKVIKLISIFSITTLIFIAGYLAGDYIGSIGPSLLDSTKDDLYAQFASLDAQYELLREDPCIVQSPAEFSDMLDTLNERLEIADQKEMDPEMIGRFYTYYFALEAKHFLLVEEINTRCDKEYLIILYFYSNIKCDLCQEQGMILSRVKSKHSDVMIYSFNIDSSSPVVNTLRRKYNVDSTPTVIIPGEARFEEFVPASTLMNTVVNIKHNKEKTD